jgi:Luciferase-like monooxygenase
VIGIQDHPYQRRYLETWSLIADLIARTDRVRFFPDVANLPLRFPAMIAKRAATLDVLSGGRFELGLGAGAFWEAIGAMGGPFELPARPSRHWKRRSRAPSGASEDVVRVCVPPEKTVRSTVTATAAATTSPTSSQSISVGTSNHLPPEPQQASRFRGARTSGTALIDAAVDSQEEMTRARHGNELLRGRTNA